MPVLLVNRSMYKFKINKNCKNCYGKGIIRYLTNGSKEAVLKPCVCVELNYMGEVPEKKPNIIQPD